MKEGASMMRKFNKKRVSRRGAILVTVVFILAFATIFIAAAMTLTQATRKRIYTESHSDQARLTVTSVAEAFLNAKNMCEFDDDVMVSMCMNNADIHIYASDSTQVIPGLETEDNDSTDSYTTAKFYRQPNTAGAQNTEHQKFTYYIDFSTHIFDKVENVRAQFSYTPVEYHSTTEGGSPFDTQIDLNAKFGQNNLSDVGDGGGENNGNIFLVRKGGANIDSSFSSEATMIYCAGKVGFKDEVFNASDLVFLDGAVLHYYDGGGWKGGSVENLFFFGNDEKPGKIADTYPDGTNANPWKMGGLNFFLCNRTADDEYSKYWVKGAGSKVYTITADGDFKSGSAKPSWSDTKMEAFKLKVQRYAQYNEQYKSGGSHAYPTTQQFLDSTAKFKVGDKEVKVAREYSGAEANKYTLKEFEEKFHYENWINNSENIESDANKKGYLPSGIYQITEDGGSDQKDNNRFGNDDHLDRHPYIFVLDGSKSYRFYFAKNEKFYLRHVVFIVANPKPANPVLFILEDGAKIYWPGNKGVDPTTSNGYVGANGIFAVEGRTDCSNAKKCYDFIIKLVKEQSQDTKSYANSWGLYDGSNHPCAMVLGMSHNDFAIDKAVVLESFVGMFNDSYDDDAQSKVAFRNGDAAVFYGRLMTDGLGFQNPYSNSADSGNIFNPACPGSEIFETISGGDSTPEKMRSGFTLEKMIYYYNIQSANQG